MMEKIALRIQSICKVPCILLGSILVLGFIVSIPAEAAARFKLLQSLGYSVGSPSGKLTRDSAGNLYGATSTGGGNNAGTVFKLKPSGKFIILHEFDGGNGGASPLGLILATDGSFYGVTGAGGSNNAGVVFKLDSSRNFSILYEFDSSTGKPSASLIQGTDGNFYGATEGTIFKIDSSGNFTIMHQFGSEYNYASSPSGLLQGSDGNFYGTTYNGGSNNNGMVFKLDPSGNFTILYDNFFGVCYLGWSSDTGAYPVGELIQGSDGYFYGVTNCGGLGGTGTVYKFDLTGNFTVLVSGLGYPLAGLVQGSDGNFYGTSGNGLYGYGTLYQGTIYKIDSSGNSSVVHQFNGADGASPNTSLIQDTKGNLYGTTPSGGSNGSGTVFKITSSGTFETLYAFDGVANAQSLNGLTKGRSGNIYGTSAGGGSYNYGTVFKLDRSGKVSIQHSFNGVDDGYGPESSLIKTKDGSLYGTTAYYGFIDYNFTEYAFSTIFKIDRSGHFNVLYEFDYDTSNSSSLVEGQDGSIYGTTQNGGANGSGMVFKLDPAGIFSILHEFDGISGANPYAGLVATDDGSLYGTTAYGGGSNAGTVYKLDPSGNFSVLHEFDGADGGANPYAVLIQANDGNLYGTTAYGGSSNAGTVFKLDPSGTVSVLHQFDGGVGGATPYAGLTQGRRGSFYGTTYAGGNYDVGTVFKLDRFGNFSVVHEFDKSNGANPDSELIRARGGKFFGTTRAGGQYGSGVIFRLVDK